MLRDCFHLLQQHVFLSCEKTEKYCCVCMFLFFCVDFSDIKRVAELFHWGDPLNIKMGCTWPQRAVQNIKTTPFLCFFVGCFKYLSCFILIISAILCFYFSCCENVMLFLVLVWPRTVLKLI